VQILGAMSFVGFLVSAFPTRAMPPPTSDEVARLVAGDGDYFAYAVQVQGEVAVVGMPYDDQQGANSGSVQIFVREDDRWAHRGQLVATDGSADDYFGASVAILGDTLMVGAVGAGGSGESSGSVLFFVRVGNSWKQQQRLDPGSDAGIKNFGAWIALAPDSVLIGAISSGTSRNPDKQVACVFLRIGDKWERSEVLAGITRTGASKAAAGIQPGTEPPHKEYEGREVRISLKDRGALSEPDVEGCLVAATHRGLWIEASIGEPTLVPHSMLRLLSIGGPCRKQEEGAY